MSSVISNQTVVISSVRINIDCPDCDDMCYFVFVSGHKTYCW